MQQEARLRAARVVPCTAWFDHLIRFRLLLPAVMGNSLPYAVTAAKDSGILPRLADTMTPVYKDSGTQVGFKSPNAKHGYQPALALEAEPEAIAVQPNTGTCTRIANAHLRNGSGRFCVG
jgi:hypothetical protein